MTDDSPRTAAAKFHEPRPKNSPCPECGLPWNTPGSRHCQKPLAGTRCGIDGCTRKPLTECYVGAELVARWCPRYPSHKWRKPT